MRPAEVAARWIRALDARDLDAAAACFDPDYRDMTPPERADLLSNRERARDILLRVFGGAGDVHAELLSAIEDGDTAWTEWRMGGTAGDGSPIEFAGVTIFGVADGLVRWGRVYTEVQGAIELTALNGEVGLGAGLAGVGPEARAGRDCELCREIETGSLIAALRLRHSPDCPVAASALGAMEDAYGQVVEQSRNPERMTR